MSLRKKLQNKKRKLWTANPHCENCGQLTILKQGIQFSGKDVPNNLATIQHKYHKHDPARKIPNVNEERRWLLWCNGCNFSDAVVINWEYNGRKEKFYSFIPEILILISINNCWQFNVNRLLKQLFISIFVKHLSI